MRWLLRSYRNGLPISASKLTEFPKAKLLEVLDICGRFDGAIINSYQMAAAFPEILPERFIYLAHNVEHVSASENARYASNFLERALYHRDSHLLEPIEEQLCADAAFVWALSEPDRAMFDRAGNKSAVLPLLTPVTDKVEADRRPTLDLALIGTWTWKLNELGLRWFLEEVVPRLNEDIRIAIAGSVSSDLQIEDPRVRFCGRVPNAAAFLRTAKVVPLISRGGTGVQLKTLEAFQSGLACVATTSSLRGVSKIPENCRIADEPEEFADAIHRLVEKADSGRLPECDGSSFRRTQEKAMREALQLGLERLS